MIADEPKTKAETDQARFRYKVCTARYVVNWAVFSLPPWFFRTHTVLFLVKPKKSRVVREGRKWQFASRKVHVRLSPSTCSRFLPSSIAVLDAYAPLISHSFGGSFRHFLRVIQQSVFFLLWKLLNFARRNSLLRKRVLRSCKPWVVAGTGGWPTARPHDRLIAPFLKTNPWKLILKAVCGLLPCAHWNCNQRTRCGCEHGSFNGLTLMTVKTFWETATLPSKYRDSQKARF